MKLLYYFPLAQSRVGLFIHLIIFTSASCSFVTLNFY